MKDFALQVLTGVALGAAIWIREAQGAAHHGLSPGVYKTLQTRGTPGKLITRFFANIEEKRPVFHAVEVDLFRGETITINCPCAHRSQSCFYPSTLTSYYTSPPYPTKYLNLTHYTESDLRNDILTFADEKMGSLADISDALMLTRYDDTSRRLSFLWNGKTVNQLTILHFVCLKQHMDRDIYNPSVLITVRVIPDQPTIQESLLDINSLVYVPQNHDLVYTKEFSTAENLAVQCQSRQSTKEHMWKAVDLVVLPHNLLVGHEGEETFRSEEWNQSVFSTEMSVNFENVGDGRLLINSNSLSSMFHILKGGVYLNCASNDDEIQQVFRLVSNTVAAIDFIRPRPNPAVEGDTSNEPGEVARYEYMVTNAKAVSMLCPLETHTIEPHSLMSDDSEKFNQEILVNFPNTRVYKRGKSVVVVDFSNSSAIDDMRFEIRCRSTTPNLTSYVFALTNRTMCFFDDNRELWRPCKVVLSPSEELTVRCPRKSENKYLPLQPSDAREGYVKVDDYFVKDRHPALSRNLVVQPIGDIHKITFTGYRNRMLIRDEVHYECGTEERADYKFAGKRPIVIVKLVGEFEDVELDGNIKISAGDLLKPNDGPKLFHVFLGAGMTRKIRCSDFFANHPPTQIYPRSDWEVFDDIPRFFAGMYVDKLRGRPVYATRAMYGLTIKKNPLGSLGYMELSLSDSYKLSSRSDNALYFMCARERLWDDMHSDLVVIQVYIPSNTTNFYGVSVENSLFQLDYEHRSSTYNDATFNIAKYDVVAMHCPKGPTDKRLPECHLRRLPLSDSNTNLFNGNATGEGDLVPQIMQRTEEPGIKSLWYISTEALRQMYNGDPVEVKCYCKSEDETTLAVVNLSSRSGFTYATVTVGIMVIVATTVNRT
ncbi:BmGPI8, Sexual stage antigen, Pfam s48/45 [Babesia caballi]|uniref:BmGPI8, Sexual stage antigen, Pfam s48/45 n=1 Tax=Babesia caballi TaxID=5871 RepID=A0AAV4LLY0_BABCB|nr:BmGPI8, Sexual stage antigen, Pfam s48/45 [Babesia caballi]